MIDQLLELERDSDAGLGPRCVFLRGNHDQMMLDYLDGRGDTELWWANGGPDDPGVPTTPAATSPSRPTTSRSYGGPGSWPRSPGSRSSIAGLDTRRSVADNLADPDPAVVLWTRKHLGADLSAWEAPVVCGHTPVAEPLDLPRLIGVDTGAVFPYPARPGPPDRRVAP